jgi:hypothetical protein
MKFIGNFGFKSGRDFNKFEGINYKVEKLETPIVTDFSMQLSNARFLIVLILEPIRFFLQI